MAGIREKQGQMVFGLDIGTRSIVGTVGYMNQDKFHVVAQCVKEHETRAMLDGQIHDIGKVGATILKVKEQLQEELGRELTQVCIAAAGRVLRTVTTHTELQFESDREITPEDVYNLTNMGIEKAYEEFHKQETSELRFYCVGHTPMRFYLNGYQIGNLVGHKAKEIGVDLIATFLPDDVVDGLNKAVELSGLQVANLTLEPIAAIQVAIPEKFRMLNMALVDVGAGTSDICITKEGTIVAYGMLPVAGDSLTDILVQHCLVDFDTAEQIKRQAGEREEVEYVDIMGLPQTISAKAVEELLQENVDKMTAQVAEVIQELNGEKPVSAVFVVGGGGMISGYTESLAEKLGIPKERVAIRGKEVMQAIVFEREDALKDSLMVTPIGICLSFYEHNNSFIYVEFNGTRTKLYDNGRLTVADVAMQAHLPNEDLFPKRGNSVTFSVNGKNRIARGEVGEAAVIRINNESGDMYTPVRNGDHVQLTVSTAGEAAKVELGNLTELSEQLHITVNEKEIHLPKTAFVNGKRENEYYLLQEGDAVEIRNCYTVREIAEFMDISIEANVYVNETAAKEDTKVYEGFSVTFQELTTKEYKAEADDLTGEMKDASLAADDDTETGVAHDNGSKDAVTLDVVVNRQVITLKGKAQYVYVDVFEYIDFDLKNSAGRTVVTMLNGRPAEYMEALQDGDIVEIYWKEK